ncbi:MAG: serine/threonine-protein kinase, partial [Chloroflexota bacterium]
MLQPGVVLHSRYRVVRILGQGGFGALYRAWDTTLGRPCALKENLDASPETQRQFLREAKILANLHHPNLPRVTDYFIDGAQQYLVMDFIDGQDLQEMLEDRGGPLPENQALGWMRQVCDALAYLHAQKPPIIHRDVKPGNIKITSAGQAVLVDFGIAKVYDPHSKTTVGAQAVTPGFSPLEQYGKGQTDPRTDIYALGATLYTLLAFSEPPESVQRVVRDPLVPLRQQAPQVSLRTAAAVAKAMQMDPSLRFPSAAEFKAALTAPEQRAAAPGAAAAPSTSLPAVPARPPTALRPAPPLRSAPSGGQTPGGHSPAA